MSKNRNNKKGGKKPSGKKTAGSRAAGTVEEVTGKVCMTREGYAFIAVPEREDDIFVSARKLRGALNNDTVRVAVTKRKEASRRTEGEVIEITERSAKPFIGILQIIGNQAWVIVENRYMPYDISVPIEEVSREDQGKKVACLVTDWPRKAANPVGTITDVLGTPGENNTEMHAILAEYGLPYRFDEQVERAASGIPVKIPKEEISRRRDFRNICTFTIDPADAKDFDDALSLRKLENGNWEVGVHIADVTHYVEPGGLIDKEAIERGTSVYLVDRTVPMLPEVLSNNLCSLRPGEDKLCFSAVFELNDKAKVIGRWFGRTIIRSDKRFAYEQAQEIIESAPGAGPAVPLPAPETEQLPGKTSRSRKKCSDREIAAAVLELHRLASLLRKKRFESGAISFERPEMKVIVDENGKPIDVVQKITKEANWLIEEFMLLANREVAFFVAKGLRIKDPTFVYRIHDEPDFDKIQNLRDFIKHFGYAMGPTENAREVAVELNKLLEKTKGKPENNVIEILSLRSMARAKYSTDNVGHYGLGFDYYTHFTSPIRRYPDMMVHRLLAHYLDKGKSEDKKRYEELCQHSSAREQLATEAERSSIKYKLTEFMQDKIGNIYDGTISGVTEWGIYVEIDPTKVEGMVMLRDIKEDYFSFDEKNYCVTGKSSGKKFTLGDRVKIKVLKANLEQKLIDYALIWDESYNKKGKRSGKKSVKSGEETAKTAAEPENENKPAKGRKANSGRKSSETETKVEKSSGNQEKPKRRRVSGNPEKEK